ncbi:hypothetical protein [Embleya sp. NPDC005575]
MRTVAVAVHYGTNPLTSPVCRLTRQTAAHLVDHPAFRPGP